MAILKGPLDIKGPISGMSTYTNKRGTRIVRGKGGPSKEQIRSRASCKGIRENNNEFAGTSVMAGTLRRAFAPQSEYFSDGTYFNRLVGLLKLMSVTDTSSVRGQRHPMNGNIHLLEDLQWNKGLHLEQALSADILTSVDAVSGTMELTVDRFSPPDHVQAPAGATHFQIIARGCFVYDKGKKHHHAQTSSPLIALNGTQTDTLVLNLQVPVNPEKEGLIVMGTGIVFYEEIEGIPFAMRGKGAFMLSNAERTGSDADSRKVLRKTAMELMEQMMTHGRLTRAMGLEAPGPGMLPDLEEKLIRLEKKLWGRKLAAYRRGG